MSSTGASSLRIAIELGYQELMSDKVRAVNTHFVLTVQCCCF